MKISTAFFLAALMIPATALYAQGRGGGRPGGGSGARPGGGTVTRQPGGTRPGGGSVPGGRPGGANLTADPQVISLLKRWNEIPGKLLTALCSGTTVLAAAEVIEGKHMTGYTGYAEKLPGSIFEEVVAVADQNLVTSQGPATGYPFAFKLAETLGYDTRIVRSRLMYDYAGGFNA